MVKKDKAILIRGLSIEENDQLDFYAHQKNVSKNELVLTILKKFLHEKNVGAVENSMLLQIKKINYTNGELIELVDILEKQKKKTLQNIDEIKNKLNRVVEGE